MVSKINKGETFGGLVRYVENRKEATPIGENFLSIDQKDRIGFFNEVSGVNTRLKKKSFHASLSLSPGETLTDEQWREAAEEYVERMGFENSPWIAVKHDDKEYEHIHIVASRVDYDGKTVSDSKDVDKSFKAMRAIEKKFSLSETKKKRFKGTLSNAESKSLSHGRKLQKTQLREVIDHAMSVSSTLKEFKKEVEKQEIEVVGHRHKDGKFFGLSFKIGDLAFKASSLGKDYSLRKIYREIKKSSKEKSSKVSEVLAGVEKTQARIDAALKEARSNPATPTKKQKKDLPPKGPGMSL